MADGRLEKELAFYEKMDKKLQAYPAIISEYYMYYVCDYLKQNERRKKRNGKFTYKTLHIHYGMWRV